MNTVVLVRFDYFVYAEKLKKTLVFSKQNLTYSSGDIFFVSSIYSYVHTMM